MLQLQKVREVTRKRALCRVAYVCAASKLLPLQSRIAIILPGLFAKLCLMVKRITYCFQFPSPQ